MDYVEYELGHGNMYELAKELACEFVEKDRIENYEVWSEAIEIFVMDRLRTKNFERKLSCYTKIKRTIEALRFGYTNQKIDKGLIVTMLKSNDFLTKYVYY